MDRRTLFALPALLMPWAASRSAVAQSAGSPALSGRDRTDIARAEAWLGALRTLKARFLQIAQNGAAAEGPDCLKSPDNKRYQNHPPEPQRQVDSYGQ